MGTTLRQSVWDARLDAHAGARYFHDSAVRIGRSAKALTFLSLLASSSAVVTWANTNASIAVPILGAITAALAVLQLVLRLGEEVVDLRLAARHCEERAARWDAIWGASEDGLEPLTYPVLEREQERDRRVDITKFPDNLKLRVQAQKEAHSALGLREPSSPSWAA